MKINSILRANIFGKGYDFVHDNSFDQRHLDYLSHAFPSISYFESYSTGQFRGYNLSLPLIPCVSYSCFVLPNIERGAVFLVIGCHWLHHSDQHGRPGLSMWHGLLCQDFQNAKPELQLSPILYNLSEVYLKKFSRMGTYISDLATSNDAARRSEILNMFLQLSTSNILDNNLSKPLPALTNYLTSLAIEEVSTVRTPVNIMVDTPFSPQISIPLLVYLSLSHRINVTGGMTAERDLINFEVISIQKEVRTHKPIRFSDLVLITPDRRHKQELEEIISENSHNIHEDRPKTATELMLQLLSRLKASLHCQRRICIGFFLTAIIFMVLISNSLNFRKGEYKYQHSHENLIDGCQDSNSEGVRSSSGKDVEPDHPTSESIKVFRKLAENNSVYKIYFACLLKHTGRNYNNLGLYREALPLLVEAVKILREKSTTNLVSKRELAESLDSLAVSLSGLQNYQESIVTTQEVVKTFRDLAKVNPTYKSDIARSLNNLGVRSKALYQFSDSRRAFEQAIEIYHTLSASDHTLREALQRSLNNLEELNRKEGILTNRLKILPAADLTRLPTNNPNTMLRRSIVRIWSNFAGQESGIGQPGMGFVIKRQGNRAWIATTLNVILSPDNLSTLSNIEAELYSGTLPQGFVSPRLEVKLPPSHELQKNTNNLIILEVRSMPADIQALQLTAIQPTGKLRVVDLTTERSPLTINVFPMLKISKREIVLDGQLNPGAIGSPVLNTTGQVVGVIHKIQAHEGLDTSLVFAYRSSLIQASLSR